MHDAVYVCSEDDLKCADFLNFDIGLSILHVRHFFIGSFDGVESSMSAHERSKSGIYFLPAT